MIRRRRMVIRTAGLSMLLSRLSGPGAEAALQDIGKELPILEYPVQIGSEKQLFVDDGLIENCP